MFWILASKVIFFHNYYTNIIMITFALSIFIMINLFGKSLENRYLFVILLLLVGLLIVPSSFEKTNSYLSRERGDYESLKEVAQYLVNNTNENEIYIDDNYILTLTFLSNLLYPAKRAIDSCPYQFSAEQKTRSGTFWHGYIFCPVIFRPYQALETLEFLSCVSLRISLTSSIV